MKILVTGTAGFIGFHLINRLTSSGHLLTGIDSISAYYDDKLKYGRLNAAGLQTVDICYNTPIVSDLFPNYVFRKLNLEDKNNLDLLFKEGAFDVVIHLAAQAGIRYSLENPNAYVDSNILGFLNLIECCRHYNIKHLVYASSSSVYGLNAQIPFSTDQHTDHPISIYAATKKSNELMAHVYSHLFQLPTTGIRFFTVYGPWARPDMALFRFTRAIIKGEPIQLFNNGNMLRDFTYIDDVIEGIVRILPNIPTIKLDWTSEQGSISSSCAPYKIYNLGNNNPVSLLDFIEALQDELQIKAKIDLLPLQPGDVPITYADVSDLENDIGFKPSTSIKDGICQFVKWYREYWL